MNFTTVPHDAPSGLSRRLLLAGLAASTAGLLLPRASFAQGSSRRTFFVSPFGSDANSGMQDRPFATIGAVFRRITDLGPGDVIMVTPGTYNEAVNVTAGGDTTAYLRIVSQVPRAAKIRSPSGSYSAINIQKSFVAIDGFDVQGAGSGHGIEATFLDGNTRNNGPHHIDIFNNLCHGNAGSGISLSYGDFYRIDNNVCFGNCATNPYQGSGISVYAARAVPSTESLRIMVTRNTCYGNTALTLPNDAPHSDGNGIIIDDMRNTQKPTPAGAYPFATLVENNVCYGNGGKGIHVYFSDNVTVRNNTCCFNNRDPKNPASWRGELSNVNANQITWVNNIGVAGRDSNPANAGILDACSTGPANQNVVWRRNLTFNGQAGQASITQSPKNASLSAAAPYRNLLGVNPQFVRALVNDANPDFRLKSTSPCRDAGTADAGLALSDRLGNRRVVGKAPDIGAFEYTGT